MAGRSRGGGGGGLLQDAQAAGHLVRRAAAVKSSLICGVSSSFMRGMACGGGGHVGGGGCFHLGSSFPALILAVWAERRPAALLGCREAPVKSTYASANAENCVETARLAKMIKRTNQRKPSWEPSPAPFHPPPPLPPPPRHVTPTCYCAQSCSGRVGIVAKRLCTLT